MAKRTFLYSRHIELGAKIVDFAGWLMPVQYTSIIEEHNTVRKSLGFFDVSHMGEIIVEGLDALDFLNSLVPQQLKDLYNSKAVYCQLTNINGGVIDDLIIYKLNDNKYLIVANASRVDEDINWLALNKKSYNVSIINDSHNYSMIAVQGPKIIEFMHSIGYDKLPEFFSIKQANLFGIDLWISRTGYTGEDGVELLVLNEKVCELWDRLLLEGIQYGAKPIGLGARDTLRLEAALHLYGNDLDENTTPIEAGLSWSVAKNKEDDYNGKSAIMNQLNNGINKKLIGFKMSDKSIARHGYDIYYKDEKIGVVTSGGVSPVRGDNIGMAYINNRSEISVGSVLQVMIRDKLHNAEIVKRPFIEKRNKK